MLAALEKMQIRRQVCKNAVIPAKAGIQTRDVIPAFLDSRLRGSDEKTELVDGLDGGVEYFRKPLHFFVLLVKSHESFVESVQHVDFNHTGGGQRSKAYQGDAKSRERCIFANQHSRRRM